MTSIELSAPSAIPTRPRDRNEFVESIESLDQFAHMTGLASRARALKCALYAKLGDHAELESAASDLTLREPTSGFAWLQLAILHWRRGAPIFQTLAALEMSNVTAPHEAAIMQNRTTLQVKLWEFLPRSAQRMTIDQLVELKDRTPAIDELRAAIARKPEETRALLKKELSTRRFTTDDWVRSLGL